MRRLGDLESVVMDRLWEWSRPTSVREVVEDLRRSRSIAYTTVMTVLDNLHSKELVRRQMEGRAYRYQPTCSREEYSARLMGEVLGASHDRSGTLLSFVEHMTRDEVALLRQAFQEQGEV